MTSRASATLDRIFSFGHCSCKGPNATSSKTVGLNSCTSGFWKDQRYPAAKGQSVVIALKEIGGQRLSVEEHRAFRGKVQGIENSQQCRFSRPVGAQQRDAFSVRDFAVTVRGARECRRIRSKRPAAGRVPASAGSPSHPYSKTRQPAEKSAGPNSPRLPC